MEAYWLAHGLMIAVACLCVVLPLLKCSLAKQTKIQIFMLLTCTAVPLGAYWFYEQWGANSEELAYFIEPEQEAQRQKQKSIRPLMAAANKRIYKLRLYLNENPDDYLAWCDLGRLYSATHEWPYAVQAWQKARELTPPNARLLAEINANYYGAKKKVASLTSPQP